MKRLFYLIPLLLLLAGCGRNETPVETPEPTVEETPEPLPEMYYYDLGGIYLNASAYFAPIGVTDDLEAWNTLRPKYAFQYSNGSYVYIGEIYDKSYSGFTYNDKVQVCSHDKDALYEFSEALIEPVGDYVFYELEPPQLSLSSEIQQEIIQNSIDGYDADDIVMYAIVTMADGRYIAVCKRDVGHMMQITYIKPEELTCSLRDGESTLLVEDTGELLPLEWYLNPNYTPNRETIPEITP